VSSSEGRFEDLSMEWLWLLPRESSADHGQQPDPQGERMPTFPTDMTRKEGVRLTVNGGPGKGSLDRVPGRIGKRRVHEPPDRTDHVS